MNRMLETPGTCQLPEDQSEIDKVRDKWSHFPGRRTGRSDPLRRCLSGSRSNMSVLTIDLCVVEPKMNHFQIRLLDG